MKAFSVLFQERNSPIIIYNGKTVYRYLRCTEKGKYILKFRNIKTRASVCSSLWFIFLKWMEKSM